MIAPTRPSAVPPILASHLLKDNERLTLISLLTAHTLAATDNGLKAALFGARQLILKKRTWSLHSGGLVVQLNAKTKRTCMLGVCSCGASTWCDERALLLVLQTYLATQELVQRMDEEASWSTEVEHEEQLVADGLIHVRALQSVDRVAA